jgi:predicted outer membrane protein
MTCPSYQRTVQGAAFDRAYIQHMVKDHEADVKLFRTQARQGHCQVNG